ncbi:MAG: hypothetical protein COV66_01205 [Nitrospinae bacterium CG11_big_fil_rev_8_21_14_0_20_45_15]|nr:MAG: hypothetical protein COV66_01205 [Nitrospinae bacterium CG11_big_fil_rev_8_21_14_0_20_45_15]
MAKVKRIVLDVLKPHHPSALEFAKAIADQENQCNVKLTVEEVDEKTESIVLVIEGEDIQFDGIVDTIKNLGGSVHSIDGVEVEGTEASPQKE